ncbi:uncharacterized protein NEMAJ01_0526 [Nematocida major]|uniref:uncharacterized protein n=1 Tax=Nematocida major TaxID=1912982 RepID=UPI002008880A|nr:uncharacterized protein NEMAJ01_0526 [Nematocida major]KAH9385630.1 hypothetical protein NEMAJ01_0526 [Nematocida major]
MHGNIEAALKRCDLKERLNEIYAQERRSKPTRIVLGNTSCDQDSFLGAHVLGVVEGRIPVVNMPREVFSHKLDLCFMVSLMGLELDDLVFLEESEDGPVLVRGRQSISIRESPVSAFLVDFSNPEKELLACSAFSVERIIDHRQVLEGSRVILHVQEMWIDLHAGSCCSLIFHYIQTYYRDELKLNPGHFKFLFLLSMAILTDTSFLTERIHKLDVLALDRILAFTGISIEETKLVHAVVSQKQHCERAASTDIILQMCHKRHEYPDGSGRLFGVSLVKYGYDEWVARDTPKEFLKKMQEFTCRKGYEFLIVNSIENEVREFFVFSPPAKDFAQKVLYGDSEERKREVGGHPELPVYRTSTFFVGKMVIPKILRYLKNMPG